MSSYPTMETYYSWIAGVCYVLPFSIGGMSLNLLKPGYNRTALLIVLLVFASGTTLVQGTVDSLPIFAVMRIIHALINSAILILIFDTIADYFP